MLYILQARLQAFLTHQIAPEQAGFVKGRGTREQILNGRQLIEKARIGGRRFSNFRFADDTLLIVQNAEELLEFLRRLEERQQKSKATSEDRKL
ncbi:hypothetical protein ILUMI_17875 [Ignelater luminosus]|uniref:Reverse transcriptase domain-containing protein n=1 Tax=Ignelater luminosus TaxID=2038154 RepID=A0A8K0G7H3_IGNLU|nr:hypothetical protein ILUMI_17875 [Ignelater luminosus]